MNSTATFDGVLRRTGCRELFAGEKKEGNSSGSRETERQKGREQRVKRRREGLPEASARERLFTMKITYMYSFADIYPLVVYTAREER